MAQKIDFTLPVRKNGLGDEPQSEAREVVDDKDHPLPTFEVLSIAIQKQRHLFISQPTVFHAIEREWRGAQSNWPPFKVLLLLLLLAPFLALLNIIIVCWTSVFGNHSNTIARFVSC